LCVAAVAPAYVNHDAAWYLYMARRWFGGATLYREVIDTNPPLIIWLSSPPVWLAGVIGAGAPAVFKAYVFGLAAVSLLLVRALIRAAWPDHEFLLVSSAVFLCLPFVKGDYGQREHFAVLLTLPYIVSAAAPGLEMSARWRSLLGIAGALGFAIKPHFLVAWASVEAVVIALGGRRALRRPELVAAVVTFAAYAILAALTASEYLAVASEVRAVYGGLNSPVFVLLRLREVQLWLAALALFAAIRWPPGEQLPVVIFAAATGYLLAAVLQLKGWGYHLYPARALILLFLAASVGTVLNQVPSLVSLLRGGRRGLALVFAGALVVASGRYIAEARTPATPDLVTPLIQAVETLAPEGPLAVLSMRTIIYPAFPAVNYAGPAWALRHHSLWFLSGLYEDQDLRAGGPLQPHALDRMNPLERHFFDQILEDLCAAGPRLIAIEQPAASAPAGRRALDLRDYYAQSPRGRRLLEHYQPRGTVGPFTLFTPTGVPSCD
jgi:hypothetical protein